SPPRASRPPGRGPASRSCAFATTTWPMRSRGSPWPLSWPPPWATCCWTRGAAAAWSPPSRLAEHTVRSNAGRGRRRHGAGAAGAAPQPAAAGGPALAGRGRPAAHDPGGAFPAARAAAAARDAEPAGGAGAVQRRELAARAAGAAGGPHGAVRRPAGGRGCPHVAAVLLG